MRVVDKKEIKVEECKITFIRINPENKKETIERILNTISDLSWINKLIPEDLIPSLNAKAVPTVDELTRRLNKNKDDNITKEIGEYFVSELARETIVNEMAYSDIPLTELWKEKVTGNPGFDYHSENKENIIIFGEAKYLANQNAYNSALKQVVEFIDQKKDIKELAELKSFVTQKAVDNANNARKGYAIGFSSYKTSTDNLIKNIQKNENFNELIKYEELVIVAVNING